MFAIATRSVLAQAAYSQSFASYQQARNMATLKEISMRLKSISNIAKITKSMKMIASTKVSKAQRAMEAARAYGSSANVLFHHAETSKDLGDKNVILVVSSDRGLCGGIHSSVSKGAKKAIAANPSSELIVLGQKAKAQLQRDNRENIAASFDQVAKNLPTWTEAALIGHEILVNKGDYTSATVVFNEFKSVIAFETIEKPIYTADTIAASPKIPAYETEGDVLKNFEEFTFANTLYWAIAEGYASEMTAKRTAMENATKNADEMIQKLTLTYNRSRQATITNELIDIITGASAM